MPANYGTMNFPDNVTRLCGRKRFSFGCHSRLPCFTECCRELELVLTPYDVLCLRRELHLNAAEFLDRYVIVEEDEKGGFPVLYLGMVDDGRASCPFISEKGCKVYNGRPGACRAYPVGRGVTRDRNGVKREIHVLIREEHCLGFNESQAQDTAEWFESQGLKEYNVVNDEVMDLLHHKQVQQGKKLTPKEKDAYILALYKLDEFRSYASSFQDKFRLGAEELHMVHADELQLLRFGIRWLKEVLFSEKI